MLSEVFWVAFVGTVSGMIIKLGSMIYKSKCSECNICGLFIKRDVLTEEKEHEYDVIHKHKSTSIDPEITMV
jgi:hypothetical protein